MARARSLTESASSPSQSQGNRWQQRCLVCVRDLAESVLPPNQHRWHRRLRRSLAHVCNLEGSASSPYQRQGYRRQHRRWARVRNLARSASSPSRRHRPHRHTLQCFLRAQRHRTLETRLVVGMLQRQGYKFSLTGAATPPRLQEQFHDSVLAEDVTKFSSL